MTTRTIVGLYDSYDQAVQTVRDLEAAHIPDTDISIVAHRSDAHDVPSKSAHGATTGAGTGATAGAAIGGGVGLLAGLGMLAIPGVGPVVAAGWLVATAVGAVAGAAAGGATGGLIGLLTSAGVTKEHANFYAEAIRRGGSLVIARVDKKGFSQPPRRSCSDMAASTRRRARKPIGTAAGVNSTRSRCRTLLQM